MRDALAERLLANVMNWSPADVARERPTLQALALLKYDEYQQFSPGIRFVESLALWLEQFAAEERQVAYDFIRSRLVFLSEAEMAHFAAVMYPDLLRPMLLQRAANEDSTPEYRVSRVAQGATFARLQGSTLFFGLSDGARIDQFRRSNRELSHEQIFASCEIPEARVAELRSWLDKRQPEPAPVPVIVLLDDFAGSGTTCVCDEAGELKGKIAKFLQRIASGEEWKGLVRFPDTNVVVALYVATAQALNHIQSFVPRLEEKYGAQISVRTVQRLDERVRITADSSEAFLSLVEHYYDKCEEDEHTQKGGTERVKHFETLTAGN